MASDSRRQRRGTASGQEHLTTRGQHVATARPADRNISPPWASTSPRHGQRTGTSHHPGPPRRHGTASGPEHLTTLGHHVATARPADRNISPPWASTSPRHGQRTGTSHHPGPARRHGTASGPEHLTTRGHHVATARPADRNISPPWATTSPWHGQRTGTSHHPGPARRHGTASGPEHLTTLGHHLPMVRPPAQVTFPPPQAIMSQSQATLLPQSTVYQ
ncbi:uncharacterized protein LOC141970274 [Athene noctua]|uniref:uncharacterized protein LOC141970274 n=1 Tax=Athene noctua TaxID=126797 RepID=UPI003EBFE1AC